MHLYVEIESKQSSKSGRNACGDVVCWERTPSATTIVCADGIGSGIKANIAATMCAARLMELIRSGFSLREAFARVVRTMNGQRSPEKPYSVFTVARILNGGDTTILSYEMPAPIYVGQRQASVLHQRILELDQMLLGEAVCHLEPGEGLLIVSDGISQAGMGQGLGMGWGIEGVAQFATESLSRGVSQAQLPLAIHDQARLYWRRSAGDDCTCVVGSCRWGRSVHVLTGPPALPELDADLIRRFLSAEGYKVVCGATTAKLVAKALQSFVEIDPEDQSMVAPPKYVIEGIDLVTEGAVTLNQVYNIIEEDPSNFGEKSGVTELCELLQKADRVDFYVGTAMNPANANIAFRQKGILHRTAIVPLLAGKLEKAGKLVVVKYF